MLLFRRKRLKGPRDDSWGLGLSLVSLEFAAEISRHKKLEQKPHQLLLKHAAREWHRKELLQPFTNKAVGLTTLFMMETCGRLFACGVANGAQATSASLEVLSSCSNNIWPLSTQETTKWGDSVRWIIFQGDDDSTSSRVPEPLRRSFSGKRLLVQRTAWLLINLLLLRAQRKRFRACR